MLTILNLTKFGDRNTKITTLMRIWKRKSECRSCWLVSLSPHE